MVEIPTEYILAHSDTDNVFLKLPAKRAKEIRADFQKGQELKEALFHSVNANGNSPPLHPAISTAQLPSKSSLSYIYGPHFHLARPYGFISGRQEGGN